jgi:hypothetical protein
MSERWHQFAQLLCNIRSDLAAADLEGVCAALGGASDDEVARFLAALTQRLTQRRIEPKEMPWQPILAALVARTARGADAAIGLSPAVRSEVVRLYRVLGGAIRDRHQLLTLLSTSAKSADLAEFVALYQSDPPRGALAASAPFLPLMRRSSATAIYPGILTCLENPDAAAAILDLANHLCRSLQLAVHPAAGRCPQLVRLLDGVTRSLEDLCQPTAGEAGWRERGRAVVEGIGLAVSLCDALGSIGNRTAAPALQRAMELRHRRVRVEAAAALARLGDPTGKRVLLESAAEPVVRLRAIKYAEELGIEHELSEQCTSPVALAEAELATFLSQPTQMGVAPTSCELIDSRTLYWPGYEEPRMCFLFRYSYQLLEGEQLRTFSNIGLAGPVVNTCQADLADLPLEDIYAAFAGWDAEHDEIQERDAAGLSIDSLPWVREYLARLRCAGFTDVRPVTLGRFFGDDVLVALARKQDCPGVVAADRDSNIWFAARGKQHPIGPAEAYSIYKGRRLLRAFNG